MSSYKSWVTVPKGSHFSLANIPFGIISTAADSRPRPAVAIGEHVLDLCVFAANGGFSALPDSTAYLHVFQQSTLNDFAALGRPVHRAVRVYLQDVFRAETPYPDVLRDNAGLREQVLLPLASVTNHMPLHVGDYADFFAGYYHALKAIQVYDVQLADNYTHMPVGYNGRSSAVVLSGTPIRRPLGQFRETKDSAPVFGATRQLDFEVELGCFIGRPSRFSEPIGVDDAEDHIFGVVLLNDWSARDIQAWEMPPLGPVNGKSFGTSISPWVVLADALAPFRTAAVANPTTVLPYLQQADANNVYDIKLHATLTTPSGNTQVVTSLSSKHTLWSFPQMIAHQSSNGCPMRSGDIMASGTISGPTRFEHGTFLEINDNGALSSDIAGKEERSYLLDGDTLELSGVCGDDEEALVGFGTCVGTILPALVK
ncbi:hypothetical protein SEUCBS139899_009862 [Sporothrix eucalyptigena]|uniref:Fumarylacetoacetase n=1 Tax=Sporothrix eucalyptigena TaxID=1812306 RepID=A0ABP0CYD3_9PEZI